MRRIALIAILLASVSCHRGGKKVVGVVPKGTANLFWVSVSRGAADAGKQLGVDVSWEGPAQETDYSRQIQIVDSMVVRHVDALVVAATERKALVESVERAADAGIPVVMFDSGLDTQKYSSFVATDNYAAGSSAARELAKVMNGTGKVALLMNAPGSVSTVDRERGFTDTLAKDFPKMSVVAQQFGMSDRAKARTAAENMLSANPDLGGIFASAEPSSVGASLAIESRGLAGKVHLVAFDSSEGLIASVRSGSVDALVVQDPYQMGFDAVRLAVDALEKKPVPKRVDLAARVIEKGDLDKPDVQKLLHP